MTGQILSRLDVYFRKDPRLVEVNTLAQSMHGQKVLTVHNYLHAQQVTEFAVQIEETNITAHPPNVIAAALLHDTGVAIGPYEKHAENGYIIAHKYLPDMGFDMNDRAEIALAILQHPGYSHTSLTSKILYDANTLTRSGRNGIGMCFEMAKELDLGLEEATKTVLRSLDTRMDKGFYNQKAKEIDQQLGYFNYSGLEWNLMFWNQIKSYLEDPNYDFSHNEIISMVAKTMGLVK